MIDAPFLLPVAHRKGRVREMSLASLAAKTPDSARITASKISAEFDDILAITPAVGAIWVHIRINQLIINRL